MDAPGASDELVMVGGDGTASSQEFAVPVADALSAGDGALAMVLEPKAPGTDSPRSEAATPWRSAGRAAARTTAPAKATARAACRS